MFLYRLFKNGYSFDLGFAIMVYPIVKLILFIQLMIQINSSVHRCGVFLLSM